VTTRSRSARPTSSSRRQTSSSAWRTLARASRRPLDDLAPWVRALLRLTAYQLGFLDRIPPWAAVHEAVELANGLAPEHLELQVRDPEGLLGRVRHAGAVFLGRHTPEVVGDYVAGPNHVLPTGGTARFSSALSTEDFVTRLSVIEYSREGLAEAGPHVAELSRVEGLAGHGAAAAVRIAAAREGGR